MAFSYHVRAAKAPKNANYRYHLGLAYAKVGAKEKAKTALQQALDLNLSTKDVAQAQKLLGSLTAS